MVLCDLLIRLAQRGLYRALWSREILDEVVRSIARRRPDLSITLLRKRTAAMRAALQDATVENYEALMPSLRELGDDAHVAAAAVFGRADAIVTSNVRDFPAGLLHRYRIAVQSPDDFLTHHWWLDPVAVAEVLMRQSKGTSRPPLSPDDILARLGTVAPEFVRLVRGSNEYRTAMRSRS